MEIDRRKFLKSAAMVAAAYPVAKLAIPEEEPKEVKTLAGLAEDDHPHYYLPPGEYTFSTSSVDLVNGELIQALQLHDRGILDRDTVFTVITRPVGY